MSFLKNIFNLKKKKLKNDSFFNSRYKVKSLFCEFGNSKISINTIKIENYPFEPAIAFTYKIINAKEINAIQIDTNPPTLQIKKECIFITAESKDELIEFAERNNIPFRNQTWNWNWILEPYLDTELTKENDLRITKLLNENGFKIREINNLRSEVERQMYRYNFDAMLWEWRDLGLFDVLSAMKVKYNKKKFKIFYKKAMEIELRSKI